MDVRFWFKDKLIGKVEGICKVKSKEELALGMGGKIKAFALQYDVITIIEDMNMPAFTVLAIIWYLI